MDSPIADHKEYRPPTQSQNSNIFLVSIPKAATPCSFVLSAAKCFATSASSAPDFKNQSFADLAFAIVSCVVKVLDAIRNNVVSGYNTFNVSAICVPSTLDTKCMLSHVLSAFNASFSMHG